MMASPIQYDEAWSRRVEQLYATPDVIAQRKAVLDALRPQAGECIADLGAGPGMLAYELGLAVGATGRVRGIDISEPMVDLAHMRCAELPWVELRLGSVTALPYGDAEFDAAVSTQVYEYVADVETALAELRRVLQPGGRALILDTDWDTAIWRTNNGPRLRRILTAFGGHCPHPHLARQLPGLVRRAGLRIVRQGVHTILNLTCEPKTYGYGIINFIAQYVEACQALSSEEVVAWREELHTLSHSGDYFFSLNRYLFLVTPDE